MALVVGSLTTTARAEVFGGVDFPQGVASFADSVVSYEPGFGGGATPTPPHQNAQRALGAPDYPGLGPDCTNADTCPYVTLGDGGRVTLQFVDNRLTGSDSDALDLWIFEVGGDVEDTFVEVSKDGSEWFAVGKVFGSTSGIDLDAFGFGTADQFAFVRLTDDGNEGNQSGTTVGADIDAVGAIRSVAVPEPGTYALTLLGLGVLAARAAVLRRRRSA